MAVERTLILAEPDAVARGLSGEIVARFERRSFVLRGAPLLRVDGALAEQLRGSDSPESAERDIAVRFADVPV
jgi:nucleoside diphosphate kinase